MRMDMAGSDPAVLLHPPPERALQERIVSPRVKINMALVTPIERLIEQELNPLKGVPLSRQRTKPLSR